MAHFLKEIRTKSKVMDEPKLIRNRGDYYKLAWIEVVRRMMMTRMTSGVGGIVLVHI